MITLLNSLKIQGIPEQSDISEMVIPLPWATVSSWLRELEDEDKTFQTKIELLSPSGQVRLAVESDPFVVPEPVVTTTTNSPVLPIAEPGVYTIKLYFKEVDEIEWEVRGSCIIDIAYVS